MTFEYFKSQNGLWYWRARSSNGKITGDGAEGYATKASVMRAIKSFTQKTQYASMREVEFKK